MAADKSRQINYAVAAFVADIGAVRAVGRLGDGNINDTFLVEFHDRPSVVLQRINSTVFPDPRGVAANSARISHHMATENGAEIIPDHGYRFPAVISTVDGSDWFEDADGEVWRGQRYVGNAVSYRHVAVDHAAFEAGRLLAYYHRKLASFDHHALSVPLPGFHDLQGYRAAYVEAVRMHKREHTPALAYCRDAAARCLELPTLPERAAAGGGRVQVIHGDTKYDNFLFDADSGRAVALIDLDTTAPGLTAADIGDCLRSFCNPGGEKSARAVVFDIGICRRLVAGYQSAASMNSAERNLIYHGVHVMTCELGFRFLTDYLENDRYFKVTDGEENLRRATVQFKLLESIEAQRSTIESIAGGASNG